ncbi:MAG: YicC family protein [Spirochaetaceae bacterium]|jgi:uncharacterized protein (TIGR00255 family)|nr:YicC family protein [Spirochaetaceae bacterium]
MKSMTGYSGVCASNDFFQVELEIKGYNSRFLDIFVNMPPNYSGIENDIRRKTTAVCLRGKVEIYIKIKEIRCAVQVHINKEAAQAYINAAAEIRPAETLPLAALFALEGVVETESRCASEEELRSLVFPLLDEALKKFDGERMREGQEAKCSILEHLSVLNTQVNAVAALSPSIDALIKKNIVSRFEELLGNRVDEQRVLAETAALLIKWTIAEELSRLRGHLDAFFAVIEEDAPAKKLEFLCQEINREVNTIGSKTPLLEVSRSVVECKEALENIREQLRNVE